MEEVMKNHIMLLGVLLFSAMIAMGCAPKTLANPLGPSDPVMNPTPAPTVAPTPTTWTAKTMYLKITAGSPGTTSTMASVQVWVVDGGGTTYLHNGPVTLDSSNGYAWSSPQSNPYTTGTATFYFSMTTPS